MNRKVPAGTDLRGARTKKKLLLGENARQVDFDMQKTRATTLAQWAEVYLDRYAKDKRSIKEDRRHVRVLNEFFGNVLLSQITAGKIEDFKQVRKDRLTWRGDPVSVSYCNRELACLRHLLKLAVEKDLIDKAPMVRLHQGENSRDIALSSGEYQRILTLAPAHLQRIMTCAYETGMRSREITELTWDKVDMKAGVMRLGVVDTKTKHKRIIPISPTLRTVLTEIRASQRQGKVASISGYVFTWKGKAFSRQGWKRSWKTACTKAGLAGLHFHDLRHTFVTRKVREGWDYKRIMAITGHKTFSVFQRYNNPSEDDIKEVVLGIPPKKNAG